MNRNRKERVAIRTADETMLREGSRIFVLALGHDDPTAEDRLFAMSKLLADGGCGHFIGAELEGRMVGYGALVVYERLGWIAFMGTEPAHQGRGIGSRMLTELMDIARTRGIKSLRLEATNAGARLYMKHGFTEEYPGRRLEIPARCAPPGEPASPVRLAEELQDWCLTMDRRAFGEDRSKLLNLVLKDGGKLLLAGEDGFGLLHGRKLGPLVATGLEAARSILWRAGELGARVIYVPLHPVMPASFVDELQNPESEGCCMRMILGEPVDDEPGLVYAAHSAATG
ncbi:GNAT family N-acetyltransferase [Candidatus Eisenbacteria bacterium]|uniref:GNAT family N-acetyltransferase n=1 Tax=Eiseniibacteriota bacterium TaxID=2212470 RepID=A0ABV6YPZ8_UNCEI